MKIEFSLDSPCLNCSGVRLPVCVACGVCPECHKPTGCEPMKVQDPRKEDRPGPDRSPWNNPEWLD